MAVRPLRDEERPPPPERRPLRRRTTDTWWCPFDGRANAERTAVCACGARRDGDEAVR